MSRSAESANEHRREQYKSLDTADYRKRREDIAVKIRKAKKEENLHKRRQLKSDSAYGGPPGHGAGGTMEDEWRASTGLRGIGPGVAVPPTIDAMLAELPVMAARLAADDVVQNLAAVQYLRRLLSTEQPPVAEVLAAGVVPRVVQLLERWDAPALQFEAGWALTNIASGTSVETGAVVAAGAVPRLVQLLGSPSVDVKGQAVWALGNIAGDSPTHRDHVLRAGAVPLTVPLLQPGATSLETLRNATWLVSNLCRGKPAPPPEVVQPLILPLATLMYMSSEAIVSDVCWAVMYITEAQVNVPAVLAAGIAQRLVEVLSSADMQHAVVPAVRAVGNVCSSSSHEHTQRMLNAGVLAPLLGLLGSSMRTLRKEACWTLSNIAAGLPAQIDLMLNHNVMQPVVDIMRHDDYDTRKEACWVVCNALSGGTPKHVAYLVESAGCMSPLVAMLDVPDVRITVVVLAALLKILDVGRVAAQAAHAPNQFLRALELAKGVDRVTELTMHAVPEVREAALRIATAYFDTADGDGEDDEEDDGYAMPAAHPAAAAVAAHAWGAPPAFSPPAAPAAALHYGFAPAPAPAGQPAAATTPLFTSFGPA